MNLYRQLVRSVRRKLRKSAASRHFARETGMPIDVARAFVDEIDEIDEIDETVRRIAAERKPSL